MRQITLVGLVTGIALLFRKRKEAIQRRNRRHAEHGGISSLREPGRHVVVVATASVPWMTGTAVNPTLRAAYLAKQTDLKVTLLTPWIAVADQKELFKDHVTFNTPAEQAAHIYAWVKARTGFEPSFRVVFYPAEYFRRMLGIFPIGDPTQYIPDDEADVAVLEEPEHLTWYHHGIRWVDKFPHVVGVMHTNYSELSRRTLGGAAGVLVGLISHVMNALLCSIHTHKVIKLSDAVQVLPRQATQFVHGAPGSFLAIGDEKAHAPADGRPRFAKGAYTLGKMVWGKGWEELLEMLEAQRDRGEPLPDIDAFGSGEAGEAIMERAKRGGLHLHFHGRKDHLDPELREYRTFINASTSDVVATTSVEALAMGKWVIAARHPCNEFIGAFRNCLIYETPQQFSENLLHSDSQDPAPLTEDERYQLSWEAGTERFLDAAALPEKRRPGPLVSLRDGVVFAAYNTYTSVEPLRKLAGANADTGYNPRDVTDVDRGERAAKKAAARRAASSGWYRNLHGSMSFTGLAGLNVAVEGQQDGAPGSPLLDPTPGDLPSQPSSSAGGGNARRRTLPGPKAALEISTLMPPSAGPTANE